MDLNTLTLEQTKFAARTYIDEELGLSNVEVNAFMGDFLQGLVFEVRAAIWSHKLPKETKEEHFNLAVGVWDSAWQLWKANHAESKLFGWIARRWPPEKRGTETYTARVSFTMDRVTLFPEYNYPASLGSPYHQVMITPPIWEWDRGEL